MARPLYHRIADPECAHLRRWLVSRELTSEVDFQNVDINQEAHSAWQAKGGEVLPALWDDDFLIQGRWEIIDHLLPLAFDGIASEVWRDLEKLIPQELQEHMERIEFVVEDTATADLLEGMDPEIVSDPESVCGLHVGVPRTLESVTQPELFPTRVYLFRQAILDLIDLGDGDPEASLREEIAVTILHEIGHYFGLEEDDLERLGYD